jgi:hypothetical protein
MTLAEQIQSGDLKPYGQWGLYKPDDWLLAAYDEDELAYMAQREDDYERFAEWQASAPSERAARARAEVAFEDWQP